jgi:hypothetical protein
MPSRKQRRRRQKERRHEYEYVYVDEEGQEVEVPAEDAERPSPRAAKNGRDAKPGRAKSRGGAVREYQPPSWKRSARRALLFFPLFFLVFSVANKSSSVEWRVVTSFAYSALFVPLTYLMDRTAYRMYLKRSGGDREAKRR